MLCGAVACSEGRSPLSGTPVLEPTTHPLTTVAHLRGTLDVATGTLTFDPIPASGSAMGGGVSAAIYGDQGVTIRLYNSAVVTSAPLAGKKTYTANVGIRNLLGYRIGDEQNVTAPADTMGIYVFMNTAPVVSGTSSPCTCAVTVKNSHGARPFTAASNQPFWYWPEVVGPAGGGADTTLRRNTWVFEADTQVTRFNFDVLVSAAWSAPNESVWTVNYYGDSLPDTQARPRWRMFQVQGGPTETMVGGDLVISLKKTKDSLVYIRRDSVRAGTNALMEARFRLDDGGNSALPQPGIAIDDSTKYIGAFVSDSGASGRARVGFVDATGGFLPNASDTLVTIRSFRVYQLRKYGADSAVLYIDGVRRLAASYSSLPPSKATAVSPSYFEFGFTAGNVRTTLSTWDYALYKIGQATP
jgi:hypothetical protein